MVKKYHGTIEKIELVRKPGPMEQEIIECLQSGEGFVESVETGIYGGQFSYLTKTVVIRVYATSDREPQEPEIKDAELWEDPKLELKEL